MNNRTLSHKENSQLRQEGLMISAEIAHIMGDLLVITNVKTGEKRIIESHPLLAEGARRILKG